MSNSATSENKTSSRLIRLPEVRRRVPLCRATLYQLIAQGRFPKPISLGERAVAWVESEIDAWVEAKVRGTRGEGQAT